MLALVLMPSVSRVMRAVAVQTQAQEMCHGADPDGRQKPFADASHGEHLLPADGDCAYCPILASLSLPETCVFAVAAMTWPQHWEESGTFGQSGQIADTGLGARGPPVTG
jgi:hypothetical protein